MSPVVVIDVAPASLDAAFAAATDQLLRKSKAAIIFVLPIELASDGATGLALREWLDRQAPLLRTRAVALALVAPSWLTSLMIRFDLWSEPPPLPIAVRRSVDQATSWARGLLQQTQ